MQVQQQQEQGDGHAHGEGDSDPVGRCEFLRAPEGDHQGCDGYCQEQVHSREVNLAARGSRGVDDPEPWQQIQL